MEIINITPHDVTVMNPEDCYNIVHTFPASGTVVRVSYDMDVIDTCLNVPIQATRYDVPEGLPPERPGTMYITSIMVVNCLRALGIIRTDLLTPFGLLRDASGQVVGCSGLARP